MKFKHGDKVTIYQNEAGYILPGWHDIVEHAGNGEVSLHNAVSVFRPDKNGIYRSLDKKFLIQLTTEQEILEIEEKRIREQKDYEFQEFLDTLWTLDDDKRKLLIDLVAGMR